MRFKMGLMQGVLFLKELPWLTKSNLITLKTQHFSIKAFWKSRGVLRLLSERTFPECGFPEFVFPE